ncbi:MAG: ACT domain-containing protein [Pirellulaceae bacterium]
MQLNLFPETYAICKLHGSADIGRWVATGPLYSLMFDTHGVTAVCPADFASHPDRADDVSEKSLWRCFQIDGVLEFTEIGILEEFSRLLAAANISLFAISSYSTDYLLVLENSVDEATNLFIAAGHIVQHV